MGCRVGYEYAHHFSMVDVAEMRSVYNAYEVPEMKSFVFEYRTHFIVKKSDGTAITIDSEVYDARATEDGSGMSLYLKTSDRMRDYGMTRDEIKLLSQEAFDFASQMAAVPQHASLRLIPVVVHLDVCTVQQEGESFDACVDRAIRARDLVPLHLWSFTTVERKPMSSVLKTYLRWLPRTRVEDVEKGLALMKACQICSNNTKVGAQISSLPCQHAFHSRCIVEWLEDNNRCPTCSYIVYEPNVSVCPPGMPNKHLPPTNWYSLLRL